jgi:ubiquinol-cytochrome c reductase cytochrome c1 subunit
VRNILKIAYSIIFFLAGTLQVNSAEKVDFLKTDWSFKGLTGKFDRGSLLGGMPMASAVKKKESLN